MALFIWKDAYSVGVDYFDRQHKKLVAMLNDLHDAMRIGKGAEAMGRVFETLVEYTAYHFGDEEKAMAKYGYPELEEHREEHVLLTEKVLEYKKKFDGKQLLVSIELLEFLKNWLSHHIMETDKRYGPELAGKDLP